MRTYKVTVTRDDRWWMITVPELAGHVSAAGAANVGDTTQARHSGEIDAMAREYIATVVGVPIQEIAIKRF